MRFDIAVDLLQSALAFALQLAIPLLLVMLVVGLAVSLLQAVSHLQDQTITFVPKIILVALALMLFLPLLLGWTTDYTRNAIKESSQIFEGGGQR
ncbi:MAG: flagellar biosynthetic protein FliQ [Planctomycetota bacterium]|nr:flagellar biosynthetic protein FliQ [Planctomycetota bacterium]